MKPIARLKLIIKKAFPILLPLALVPEYLSDYLRYVRYSGMIGYKRRHRQLIGRIIAEYHTVEKGLVMPSPRLGFGKANILSLIRHIEMYQRRFGRTDPQVATAAAVVLEYARMHRDRNHSLASDIDAAITRLRRVFPELEPCQQVEYDNTTYFERIHSEFPAFSTSRRSVRNYSGADVPMRHVRDAIQLARHAPSSCNRQGVKAYVFSEKERMLKIMSLQGGSRGWGDRASKLIVVTSDVAVSHGVYERNRAFVDGGMYAMNLLYALHHKGIATCSLNCNFEVRRDRRLRKLCGIPLSEEFIVMVTCGYPSKRFLVARSTRSAPGSLVVES